MAVTPHCCSCTHPSSITYNGESPRAPLPTPSNDVVESSKCRETAFSMCLTTSRVLLDLLSRLSSSAPFRSARLVFVRNTRIAPISFKKLDLPVAVLIKVARLFPMFSDYPTPGGAGSLDSPFPRTSGVGQARNAERVFPQQILHYAEEEASGSICSLSGRTSCRRVRRIRPTSHTAKRELHSENMKQSAPARHP